MPQTTTQDPINHHIQLAQHKKQTGCISIEGQQGGYLHYGLIQLRKGKIHAAEYLSFKGEAAILRMKQLSKLKVSFAEGAILLAKA